MKNYYQYDSAKRAYNRTAFTKENYIATLHHFGYNANPRTISKKDAKMLCEKFNFEVSTEYVINYTF